MMRPSVLQCGKGFFSNAKKLYIRNIPNECKRIKFLSTGAVSLKDSGFSKSVSLSGNNSNLTPVLNSLKKMGIKPNDMTNLINDQNSTLFRVDHKQILDNSTILLLYGFKVETVINILENDSYIYYIDSSELKMLLNKWRSIQFPEDLLLKILSTHPQLIECTGKNVTERISYLLPYLKSYLNVGNLLINVPSVIYENWATLKQKLDFLHSLEIPRNQIVNCTALEYSLVEMKTRFEFLRRAGHYKNVVPKKKNLESKNPTILKILCTDDKEFAENIARLSLVEYETFSELYKLELESTEDENVSEEYDSE